MTNAEDLIQFSMDSSKANGLTKREYFAAMAMQGLFASLTEKAANGRWSEELTEVAVVASVAADELINALNQTK